MSTAPKKTKIEDAETIADSELPISWSWASFASITKNYDGKRIPVKQEDRARHQGPYPYYGASGIIDHVDDYLFDGHFLLIGEDGANLLARSTPIAFSAQGQFWVNNHAHILQTYGNMPFEYLEYYINSIDLQEYVTGSAQPKLTQDAMNRIPVPIPPLAEQSRIVDAVQKLFAEIKEIRNRLALVSRLLKQFRQAVLAAACSGKLTEDWRAQNPVSEDILAVINTIRTRCETAASSNAQRERLQEIYKYSEENDSGELPDSWSYVALKKLCASFDYGTSAKSRSSGRVPVLRMGNIQNSKILWDDLAYTSDRDEIQKYSLRPNTVLFNRTNSPELVGKTAIYRGERPAIFAGYLIRVVHFPELDPHYLSLCLNTNYAKKFCSRVKTDGVSQSNINAQKLGTFEVPYCSIHEQQEIVRRVEALFKLTDAIEKRVAAATLRADRLTQAILAKAFRGELVPTEAELARREKRKYESASVLLERIKAEREKNAEKQTAKRNRGTRQRKAATAD